jgi:signal peptidase II
VKYAIFSLVGLTTLALDQASKWWIVQRVDLRDEIELIPGLLSIIHAKNTGAAFSALDSFEHRMILFGVFTVVAVGVLLHTLWTLAPEERWQAAALGLLMGGAVGNAVDRARFGEVTDFIRVYTEIEPLRDALVSVFGTATWPIFNVADVGIVSGVLFFLGHYLLVERRREARPTAEG